jgi:hypothetical protein
VVDAHLDAGLLGELAHVGHVHVFVTLDEALPAQHAQLRALLGLVVPGGLGVDGRGEGRTRAGSGGGLQELATLELAHRCLLVGGRKRVSLRGAVTLRKRPQPLPAAAFADLRRR